MNINDLKLMKDEHSEEWIITNFSNHLCLYSGHDWNEFKWFQLSGKTWINGVSIGGRISYSSSCNRVGCSAKHIVDKIPR